EIPVEECAQPVARCIEMARQGDHLDAIAGRKQERLVDLLARHELCEVRRRVRHGEALANLERRCPVVHADHEDPHVRRPTPITANNKNAKPATAAMAAWRAPWCARKRAATSTP